MFLDPILAKEIAEVALNSTCDAQMSGDFDVFLSCFVLPHEVQTFEGRRVVETEADVRKIFDGIRSLYRKANITQCVRHCVEATFLDAYTISSTHESRLLRGSELVMGPYPAHTTLKLIDGAWRIENSEYAIPDTLDISAVILDNRVMA